MTFAFNRNRAVYLWAILPIIVALGCHAGPKLGRAEELYKSLGGPDFVGADGGMNPGVVFDWFDAHYDYVVKFNGKGGVCNGYVPTEEMARRENLICGGAAHAEVSKQFQKDQGR